jgi:hypothetical protein
LYSTKPLFTAIIKAPLSEIFKILSPGRFKIWITFVIGHNQEFFNFALILASNIKLPECVPFVPKLKYKLLFFVTTSKKSSSEFA